MLTVIEWVIGIRVLKWKRQANKSSCKRYNLTIIIFLTYQEEENQAMDDVLDVEDGAPVVAQNIQTHIALQVDIGMINLSQMANISHHGI